MATRDNPYGAFNFLVNLDGAGGDDRITAGFSHVSGLEAEIEYAEYRNGNDVGNEVRKIAGLSRVGDVTLKRGLIGDVELFAWLKATRDGIPDPRTVTITLLDEQRQPVCRWVLSKAQPKKWVGPALNAGASGQVAMEELQLVAERIEFEPG
jgi:phage tail-like protein